MLVAALTQSTKTELRHRNTKTPAPAAGLAFVLLSPCSSSPLQINKLVEYYQQLAQKEKIERDRKKLVRRRNYMPLAFSVSCEHRAASAGEAMRSSSLET